jgi:hypothetical protein
MYQSLSLNNVINLSVTVQPALAAQSTYNQGLYVGASTAIPSYGANSRVRQYNAQNYATQMLSDGFSANSPEYVAAGIYFSQSPQPSYLWIGRRDLTAIQTATVAAGGASWQVGDQFQIGPSANYAIGQVTSVNAGAVTGFTIVQAGTGFTVQNNVVCVALSPSVGTGLQVNITALGESLLQAVQACRAASSQWYGLAVNGAQNSDILAIAAWADANINTVRYYALLTDPQVPNASTSTDIASQLKTLNYRVFPIYSTQQGGTYPNNAYADAAVMGLESGYQTGLAGSFFVPEHKALAGIAFEPVTQSQYTAILGKNCNVIGNFQGLSMLEPGILSSGVPSFLWLYLAILSNAIQTNLVNVLMGNAVVPQNAQGQQLLENGAIQACQQLADIGFLSAGTWEGQTINIPGVSITTGQAVPNGYLVQSQPYSQQSQAARSAGQAMPLYIFATTAGAVESVAIAVYTQL